jgi:hypothetical protein
MIPARAWIIPAAAAALLMATCIKARADRPVDCTQVRYLVAHYGRVAAYSWALANGYSPKEISRIRKMCGV